MGRFTLSVMLAISFVLWRCPHAGLMVYLSDAGLLPSVTETLSPQSRMILQLSAQRLVTEDKSSSPSADPLCRHLSCSVHRCFLMRRQQQGQE